VQEAPACSTRTSSITLEVPVPGENAFLFEISGFSVEFLPEAVIGYWREGRNADPGLAEILSNELPLVDDTNLDRFINERMLPLMAADLIALGRAAIRDQEGRLLPAVDLVVESGTRCNFARTFIHPEDGAIILRWTSYAR
jgi:hypothetical protein